MLNETRQLVMVFNQLYQQAIRDMQDDHIHWLDFTQELVEVDTGSISSAPRFVLKDKYKHDGTHLNPCYVELIEKAFNSL